MFAIKSQPQRLTSGKPFCRVVGGGHALRKCLKFPGKPATVHPGFEAGIPHHGTRQREQRSQQHCFVPSPHTRRASVTSPSAKSPETSGAKSCTFKRGCRVSSCLQTSCASDSWFASEVSLITST